MPSSGFKADARRLMAENAPKIFYVSIIFLVIATVMSELEFRLPGTSNAYVTFLERIASGEMPSPNVFYSNLRPSGVALTTVLVLMQLVIATGYKRYCMKIARAQSGDFKDIFEGFQFFAKIILISLLSTAFVLLWSMLFVFPGIAAAYRYRQAYYILFDAPEKSALQCIRESKRLMAGNKLDLFLLDLSFIGWVILDYAVVSLLPLPFAFPAIMIWLNPYRGLTLAAYYDSLIGKLLV